MALASLPMYDFPKSFSAWEEFYRDWMARREGYDPPALTRGAAAFEWGGDVFLSQCCGAPFRNAFRDHLHLVAALDFGLVNQRAGYYYSVIFGEPAKGKTRLAINDYGSQSGFHAVVPELQREGIPFEIIESGSHFASLEMLAANKADMAGVDVLSLQFILQERPELARLPIWKNTPSSPALPLVTSQREQVLPLREALFKMLHEGGASNLRRFGLQGAVVFSPDDYFAIPNADY